MSKNHANSSRKLLDLAKTPSILSLPRRYCSAWTNRGGNLQRKRLRLYNRRAVVQSLAGRDLPQDDKTTREPKCFMAIITALVLLNAGRQVDWGFFCLGCKEEYRKDKTRDFKIKYTTEHMLEHIASYGPVVANTMVPSKSMHCVR
jgi:hypothetical protein